MKSKISIATYVLRPALALAAAFAIVATAVPAAAQDEHSVTVLKRNGEKIAGQFEDLANGYVYVRQSLNEQAKIPVGDVALIDVVGGASGLPETELSVARGSDQLVIFRDGTSMTGTLIDIRGGKGSADADTQRLVYFRENGEEKRVAMDRVTRIYMGNFPKAAEAVAARKDDAPVPPGAVRVPATSSWVPTGLYVKKGDRVTFNATGMITLSGDAEDKANPAGSLRQRLAPAGPLPANFAGALIGKVGNSNAFAIGDQTTPVVMPADGLLYLGINDDSLIDNQGEFIVTLNHTRISRR